MEQIFFSNDNKILLNSTVRETLQNEYNVKIGNKYDKTINTTMNYVRSKIDNNNIPSGYNKNSYLFLMNKKVLSIIMPIIRDDMNSNIGIKQSISESKTQENHFFDPMVNNRGNPRTILPPPQAQNELKSTFSFEKQFTTLQNNRNELYPKKKSIDFTDNNNVPGVNVNDLYASAIKEREEKLQQAAMHPSNAEFNKQQSSIGNFAVNQEEMNNTIESISSMNIDAANDSKSTPISKLHENINQNKKPELIEKFISTNASVLDRNNSNIVIDNVSCDPKNVILPVNDLNNEVGSPSILRAHDSSSGPYFSLSQSQTSRSKEIILPPKTHTSYKDFYITIDSHNRDLEAYPNPNYFQVKFSPTSNSRSIAAMYDSENNIIYEAKTLIFGDDRGASLSRTYDNVLEIQCLGAILPLAPIWVAGLPPKKYDSFLHYITPGDTGKMVNLLNEPYILLTIDELKGTYEGTNTPSSNAFAKLISTTSFEGYGTVPTSSFMSLKTSGPHETFKYNPTTLGKINKLTLGLFKRNGLHYPIGIDKLFIESFTLCKRFKSPKKTGYCDIPTTDKTEITITITHPEYGIDCNEMENKKTCTLRSTGIAPGDLLYFYDTTPDDGQIINFHKNVQLYTLDKYDKANLKDDNCDISHTDELVISSKKSTIKKHEKKLVEISARICTEQDLLNDDDSDCDDNYKECINDVKKYNKVVDFRKIFPVNLITSNDYYLHNNDYYLLLCYSDTSQPGIVYKEFLKVKDFNGTNVIVEQPVNYAEGIDYEIKKFGFAKKNKQGKQSNNKNSIFYKGGIRVLPFPEKPGEVISNYQNYTSKFIIDFPYDNLPEYLKSTNYNPDEVFIIQDKLQVSYTFKITSMISDPYFIDSRLNT